MSDFIPAWTAVGTGIAQGEKERREKKAAESKDAADAKKDEGDADE